MGEEVREELFDLPGDGVREESGEWLREDREEGLPLREDRGLVALMGEGVREVLGDFRRPVEELAEVLTL